MQYITGRIVIVGKKKIINKKDSSFSSIIFLIKKKMNGKIRNIAFECFGKMVEKVERLRIDDKVEVKYYIDCNQSKSGKNKGLAEDWFTNLHAKDVITINNTSETGNSAHLKFTEND